MIPTVFEMELLFRQRDQDLRRNEKFIYRSTEAQTSNDNKTKVRIFTKAKRVFGFLFHLPTLSKHHATATKGIRDERTL